jgi:hypothetical protein
MATLFGIHGQFSPSALILALPVALWEFSPRRLAGRQGLQALPAHHPLTIARVGPIRGSTGVASPTVRTPATGPGLRVVPVRGYGL